MFYCKQKKNLAFVLALCKCCGRFYFILWRFWLAWTIYLCTYLFRATKCAIHLRVLWLGFSFSFWVILQLGNLYWQSVEPGPLLIYTLAIPQIWGTLEPPWDFASSCHWNTLWMIDCSRREGESLTAHLYARKMEGSVAGRRKGVFLKKTWTSDRSSKIRKFCRPEGCGHLYGKNSGQFCRINSGVFLCTTQKKEIF